MPWKLRSCRGSSMRVSMDSLNRRKSDVQQASSIKLHDHDSRKRVPFVTTVQNETFQTRYAWRARLVEAIALKNSDKSATDMQSSCLRDVDNGIARESRSFVGDVQYVLWDNKSKQIGAIAARQDCGELKAEKIQEDCKYEPAVARCGSASCVNPRNLEKGKEKIIYNDTNCVSTAKESGDSNESIESSPSTAIPKRKCALSSTSKMPLGLGSNKRCKREDNESSCSGLLLRNGSSFLNWMSTLTNGLTMFDKSAPAVPLVRKIPLTVPTKDFGSSSLSHQNNSSVPLQATGFNSLFQSLYCHNVMIAPRNHYQQTESNHAEDVANRLTLDSNGAASLLEKPNCTGIERFRIANETFAAGNLQTVCTGDTGHSQNQVGVLPLRAVNVTSNNYAFDFRPENPSHSNTSNKSSSGTAERKGTGFYGCSSHVAMEKGGRFLESFWVTRLFPKTSLNLSDPDPCNARGELCTACPNDASNKLQSSSQQNATFDRECNSLKDSARTYEKMKSRKSPTLSLNKFKKSKMMASVFAKRSDAFKYAKPSTVQLAISCEHEPSKGIKHCTSSFAVSCNSHDGQKEEKENLICSRKDGSIVLWSRDKQKERGQNNCNEDSRGNFLQESMLKHFAASSDEQIFGGGGILEANALAKDGGRIEVKFKEVGSNSMENQPNNKQIVPYGFFVPNDISDESSVIFGAVRKLRLSRTDLIRWLKSPIMHTTLDGFFLRVRFGKWEEALGGTGYHVAYIKGAVDGDRLSVSIMNSRCQVDSRFVSNQDFQEEELKAWWSAAMKGDCKLPSKEQLDQKLREREMLCC